MTNPTLLILSPELRGKVDAKVETCLEIARAKYPKFEFETPQVRYDVKNTAGGLAYGQKWLIRFNLILCYENMKHFIEVTVPHEVAHLIQRRVYGSVRKNVDGTIMTGQDGRIKKVRSHGPEWAEVMKLFDLEPKRTHSYDVSSIQKPKRRPRGSALPLGEVLLMRKRLEAGVRRLPSEAKLEFLEWLDDTVLSGT